MDVKSTEGTLAEVRWNTANKVVIIADIQYCILAWDGLGITIRVVNLKNTFQILNVKLEDMNKGRAEPKLQRLDLGAQKKKEENNEQNRNIQH